jgi:hypothetical protein
MLNLNFNLGLSFSFEINGNLNFPNRRTIGLQAFESSSTCGSQSKVLPSSHATDKWNIQLHLIRVCSQPDVETRSRQESEKANRTCSPY